MAKISQIEKGAFLKLFNRGGYVLNFSTNDFDVFTLESVGVALCERYGMSKGKSLSAFLIDAEVDENAIIKLLFDLFKHYESDYQYEIENSGEYGSLYKKCKTIMDRIEANSTPFIVAAELLKEKFSSEYISSQIDIMLKMQHENPTEAIGKAKELIESCCKTIIENSGNSVDKDWDVGRLTSEAMSLLRITPKDISDTAPASEAIKTILGNLRAIASNIATLRNAYGSGHGKSASYKGLELRHAKLAVGSSITLVNFLWDSFERRNQLV